MTSQDLLHIITNARVAYENALVCYYTSNQQGNLYDELLEKLIQLRSCTDKIITSDYDLASFGCRHYEQLNPDYTLYGYIYCEDCYSKELDSYMVDDPKDLEESVLNPLKEK